MNANEVFETIRNLDLGEIIQELGGESHILTTTEIIILAASAVIGILLCMFGLKIVRVWAALTGLAAGFAAGAAAVQSVRRRRFEPAGADCPGRRRLYGPMGEPIVRGSRQAVRRRGRRGKEMVSQPASSSAAPPRAIAVPERGGDGAGYTLSLRRNDTGAGLQRRGQAVPDGSRYGLYDEIRFARRSVAGHKGPAQNKIMKKESIAGKPASLYILCHSGGGYTICIKT